jgi:hypothetical protein
MTRDGVWEYAGPCRPLAGKAQTTAVATPRSAPTRAIRVSRSGFAIAECLPLSKAR